MIYFVHGVYVCLFVCRSLHLVRFGQLLRYADKRIVSIFMLGLMKVYIEGNSQQVEFIRCRNILTVYADLRPGVNA